MSELDYLTDPLAMTLREQLNINPLAGLYEALIERKKDRCWDCDAPLVLDEVDYCEECAIDHERDADERCNNQSRAGSIEDRSGSPEHGSDQCAE